MISKDKDCNFLRFLSNQMFFREKIRERDLLNCGSNESSESWLQQKKNDNKNPKIFIINSGYLGKKEGKRIGFLYITKLTKNGYIFFPPKLINTPVVSFTRVSLFNTGTFLLLEKNLIPQIGIRAQALMIWSKFYQSVFIITSWNPENNWHVIPHASSSSFDVHNH